MAEERSASVDATLCNLERREKYLLHRRARAVETMAKRKIETIRQEMRSEGVTKERRETVAILRQDLLHAKHDACEGRLLRIHDRVHAFQDQLEGVAMSKSQKKKVEQELRQLQRRETALTRRLQTYTSRLQRESISSPPAVAHTDINEDSGELVPRQHHFHGDDGGDGDQQYQADHMRGRSPMRHSNPTGLGASKRTSVSKGRSAPPPPPPPPPPPSSSAAVKGEVGSSSSSPSRSKSPLSK